MTPITPDTLDATQVALIRCRAAQSRAHKHKLAAVHALASLMRSSTANWADICHWAGVANHYEAAARCHQQAAAYFIHNLNNAARRRRQTAADHSGAAVELK